MDREHRQLRWWDIAQAVRGQEIGRRVVYRAEVDSTMDVCHALARAGADPGVVVVADAQTAGRGRQGRSWQAPPGSSLLFSLWLQPALAPDRWPLVLWPLAIALQEAITRETCVCPAIKWPNDLVIDGRKLGGLLAETAANGVVVGAGLNVNFAATDLTVDQPLTTLAEELGRPVSREDVLIACLRSFAEWYQRWQEAPDVVWQAWRDGSCLIGQEVQVSAGGSLHGGIAVDQDRDGYLCVRTGDGRVRRFAAGDASVRLSHSK